MLIKTENLQKEFVSGEVRTKVLFGICLEIRQGEFTAIMGPSGSGKSTLMHILGFLDRATAGHYFFDGRDTSEFSDDELADLRNQRVGFVFQSFNLMPRTTVLDNVKLPLTYARGKVDIEAAARESLKSVGLEHRLDYFTNQISGGEKQRVAIARALVNRPAVIFADEPTGNLDSRSGVGVMEILQRLHSAGNTIALVTHETFTAEHAERVIKLKDGLVVSDEAIRNRRFAHEGSILK